MHSVSLYCSLIVNQNMNKAPLTVRYFLAATPNKALFHIYDDDIREDGGCLGTLRARKEDADEAGIPGSLKIMVRSLASTSSNEPVSGWGAMDGESNSVDSFPSSGVHPAETSLRHPVRLVALISLIAVNGAEVVVSHKRYVCVHANG